MGIVTGSLGLSQLLRLELKFRGYSEVVGASNKMAPTPCGGRCPSVFTVFLLSLVVREASEGEGITNNLRNRKPTTILFYNIVCVNRTKCEYE